MSAFLHVQIGVITKIVFVRSKICDKIYNCRASDESLFYVAIRNTRIVILI